MRTRTPAASAGALQTWAQRHELAFAENGLLPAAGGVLSAGLGAGSHRSGFLAARTRHGYTRTGGLARRSERESFNLCTGTLPGGVDGTLAHHLHLDRWTDEGWTAIPHTVVLAQLPEGGRVVRDLRGAPSAPAVRVGAVLDLRQGDAPPEPPATSLERHGWRWTAVPAEDERVLDALLGGAVGAALARAPEGAEVTMRDGLLVVAADGLLVDEDALEALCMIAAALAVGAWTAVALRERLDPAAADGAVAPAADAPFFASVDEAVAASAQDVRGAERTARIVRTVALLTGLAIVAAFVAADVLVLVVFDVNVATQAVVVAFTLLVMVPGVLRGARHVAGIAGRQHVAARAVPRGRAAFLDGYAARHGLRVEDPDALRRAFDSPLPGTPIGVLHGTLAPGVDGRLVLWRDRTDEAARRAMLLAIVPADGPAPAALDAAVHERAGARVVVHAPLPDGDPWTAAELDRLRAALTPG